MSDRAMRLNESSTGDAKLMIEAFRNIGYSVVVNSKTSFDVVNKNHFTVVVDLKKDGYHGVVDGPNGDIYMYHIGDTFEELKDEIDQVDHKWMRDHDFNRY
jgi:uncharacterized protein (DUF488 family)